MSKKYYVYIIQCKTTGNFYTGISDNYIRRIAEHGTFKKGNVKSIRKS
ncbi:hypothetical protein COV24_02720 [candidate division WWE3 bacterium CG10_big_fil_rev_8_21_14_0_10_32_10]|uniref:GIY-YIG domain-containing protein n=1 Tax=candidate division WWE3 bacterium CG10_big_fil_rev_8_21_14_0_10_32_10 TaxID=1975090 RepID=A0A2H0RAF2_UNCKA|nr:MAG: hypothetical protein COV24_02720 [candidate division WWE3 bacterium CG10_big_fil_rev_8_21_14_0_10_32_10]